MDLPRVFLLLLIALPLAAAVMVAALGPRRAEAVRWISLVVSVVSLVVALTLAGHLMAMQSVRDGEAQAALDAKSHPTFRPEFVPGPALQNRHATTWDLLPLGSGGAIQFFVGLDGLNVWLVVLTAVLMLPSVLISWRHISERINEFFAWLLALQSGMFGVFLAFDAILFYVFFELTLVPLFFLIGIWGGPERRHAARKFFIYTLAGSLITLLGILGIVLACYSKNNDELTFSIPRLVQLVHLNLATGSAADLAFWSNVQFYCFLALMVGLAVKVPLFPLHTWLPLAHVEAPTAGSVDLAGVLLKIGAYGFLRLCVPLAPDVSLTVGLPLVTLLAAIGIIYGAFCAFPQDDVKKLVAYSSVSHLGLAMLGMFALNSAGLSGSLMQMVNHGLSTGALFLLIGMIYERYHTRKLSDYSGMASRFPLFGVFMVFTCLSSAGLPGLNGFIGEVLVLMGIVQLEGPIKPTLAIVGVAGIVLGAWYLLTMIRYLLFGQFKEPVHEGHEPVPDLDRREVALIVPIAALCLLIGVYPQPMLTTMRPDVEIVSDIAQRARARQQPTATALAAGPTEEATPVSADQIAAELARVFALAAPEAVLVLTACVLFVGATFRAGRHLWGGVALLGVAGAGLTLAACPMPNVTPTISPLVHDRLALIFKVIALVGGAVLVLFSWDEVADDRAAEYHACLLLTIAGLGLSGSANDLVTLFLALELISIPSYVLLYMLGMGRSGQEAALKYFLLSIFSSALLLFGFSYLYGLSGTTNIAALMTELTQRSGVAELPAVAVVGLMMVVAGLSFKIAAVPFHWYAPDVYQGSPTSVVALLAFVPKAAGFVALIRVLGFLWIGAGVGAGQALSHHVPILLWILAAMTMTLGNILALLQDNLKRLLAYSSVAHAGYMLLGLAVTPDLSFSQGDAIHSGVPAVLFYLIAYSAMTVGAFAVLTYLNSPQRPVENVDDLAGLSRRRPGVALVMALFLFSLIGIPLTAGFAGKLLLFLDALAVPGTVMPEHAVWFRRLAVLMALNAAAGAWYYLRLVAVMYLRDGLPSPAEAPARKRPILGAIGICAAVTLGLGVYPGWLVPVLNQATRPVEAAVTLATVPTSAEQAALP